MDRLGPWLHRMDDGGTAHLTKCMKYLPTSTRSTQIRKVDPVISILATIAILVFQITIGTFVAWAGPPFRTDDPETVGYRGWEIDVASVMSNDKDGTSATAPQIEANYGLLANLDLHIIAPFSYVSPNEGSAHYGFGDIELGVKYRFVQENHWFPTVATFPLVEIPTGNQKQGLGSGHVGGFIPLWLQKSWGPWATYGGGGYWINPGSGNKNYWFIGWVGQRDLSEKITLGGELFYTTPQEVGQSSETGFNVGGFLNLTEEHHVLLSAGRDIHGPNRFFMYLGYQLTIGPREGKKDESLSLTRSKILYK
jgi:hypothetical protein